MGKQRDLADGADVINFIDGLTSSVQTQLDDKATLDGSPTFTGTVTASSFSGDGSSLTGIDSLPSQSGQSGKYLTTDGTDASWGTVTTDPTLGTLTKTFTAGEASTINLTSSVLAPVVSVTKEVTQSGVTNNNWDVNSTTENYTRLNSAYATTLNWVGETLSGASFVDSFSVSAQETNLREFVFNTDGTKLFLIGNGSDSVNEYSLSSAFDISTASYSQTFNVSAQDAAPQGIAFNNDGTKMFITGVVGQDVNEYSLSSGFDVSTASYSQNFSVASQDTFPAGISFNADGTKMFVVGNTGQDVNEYTLSTGFDVSTASFVDSFSVSSQDTSPQGLAFNTNGTKMFVVGLSGGDVNEYTLSTGFDVSTATYSQNFSTASQDSAPQGITFGGQKMFISGNTGDAIYEYNVDTSLALGTGSFASADVGKTIKANSGEFVLTATDGSYVETTAPTSYDQVASGSWEMYGVVYNAADGDLQLSSYIPTLESFADADRWTYNNSSFTLSSQDTSPVNLFFKPDGTKMYVAGFQNNRIHQYTLSTAWDLSTASYDSVFLQTNEIATIGLLIDANISTNGDRIYALDYSAGNSIHEFSLSTPWDLSTATYTNRSKVVPGNSSYCFEMKPDGTKLFIWNSFNHVINQATLSTPWDISTASFSGSYGPVAEATETYGMLLNTAGTKMWLTNYNTNTILQYSLSTPWDVTTITYDSISLNTNAVTGASQIIGIALSTDESKGYLLNYGTDILYEYKTTATGPSFISTGYHPVHTTASIDSTYWTDINSMTADQAAGDGNVYYAISTDDRTTWTVIDNTDGERDIVRNNAGTWQYNSNATYASETWVNGATNTELATLAEAMEGAVDVANGFDVSTAVYNNTSLSISSQETAANGITFNNDGTQMYIAGLSGQDINEYLLSSAFDVSTASFVQNFSISSQDAQPRGVAFNATGSKMFVSGDANNSVYEYNLSSNFNISTAVYSQSFSVAAQDISPSNLTFNNDGSKMFVVGYNNDNVYEYALSSSYDISTASFTQSKSILAEGTYSVGLKFNPDGTKMYTAGYLQDVNEYTLSSAFDISTASFSVGFDPSAQGVIIFDLAFNTDGTKMILLSDAVVNEYSVGTQSYTNQMDKTQLDAVTDPNHIALGNDLDLAIVFNMTSGTTVPSSDGVAINYDANVLNKGAVLGTDYDFDAPAGNSVRVTALTAGNFKVRVL